VSNAQPVVSLNVGIEAQDPRISDLVFHLISPNGTRVLLMENRGGTDTNGAGVTVLVTNVVVTTNAISSTNNPDTAAPGDYGAGRTVAGWVVNTNQVSLVTDPANAAPGNSNLLALAGGSLSTTVATIPGVFYTVNIPYRGPGIAGWWRGESNAVDSINGNNGNITFTSTDTIVWTNGFEGGGPGNYSANAGTYFAGGWFVEGPGGSYINVITNGTFGPTDLAYQGGYCINLAGAGGCGIATNIATVPGITYTLDFAYTKNPDTGSGQVGIVVNGTALGTTTADQHNTWPALRWRTASYAFTATTNFTQVAFLYTNASGPSNVLLDAIGLTTNLTRTVAYTNGEVGTAFKFDGYSSMIVPASSSLAVSNFTLESWIFPVDFTAQQPIFDYGGAGQYSSISLWLNTQDGLSLNPGGLHAAVRGQIPLSLPYLEVDTANTPVKLNQWNQIAFAVNLTTRTGVLYCNGVPVSTNTVLGAGPVIPIFPEPLNLGYRNSSSLESLAGSCFKGNIDEASVYNRPLSASEVKAIYAGGTNGKFDPVEFATSPALSLAEGQVRLNGQTLTNLYGNNTNWQTYTAKFKAAAAQTTLTLAGVQPGLLLGPMVLTLQTTNVLTNNFYLAFTEDTNLTTTPIKFAPAPFVPGTTTNNVLTDGFEQTAAGDYTSNSTFGKGWTVTSNQVSVVNDPVNACAGDNFLALAGGTIFTNLPTVAGKTYALTFAYRGPGITAFWRGENNDVDSINGNNGTTIGSINYAGGEVGQAFSFDGTSGYVNVPASPALNAFNRITVEAWIKVNRLTANPEWEGIITKGNASWRLQATKNANTVYFASSGTTPNADVFGNRNVNDGNWHDVVGVYDGVNVSLYVDGTLDAARPASGSISVDNNPVSVGYIANSGLSGNYHFNGLIDEASIYYRALSASEIKAIYQKRTAGKFDAAEFATSPGLSLAEAQVSLNGQPQGIFYGNNTNWQVESITFTATQNGTPLSITGLEPGMLLDNFSLAQDPGNLYYLPEQSLDAFNGENAQGTWQLEIQDDRAGAGLTNLLVSWDLQFVFANTNSLPLVLGGGIGQTNQFLPAGAIAWYQISAPPSASYATNRLLFASLPVNVWFDTNNPPATNLLFLPDAAYPSGTNGSILLSTTNAPLIQPPPNIYPGQTYYLGVQNPNAVTVNYGIEVDFDQGNAAPLVISGVAVSGNATTFKWTASPTAQFEVEWSDDLTKPWQTDTNVITSSDGNFTFTDDGAQTAPLGAMRFYRLVQISP
jgi:subtilisin-like proprotein convertase family protein